MATQSVIPRARSSDFFPNRNIRRHGHSRTFQARREAANHPLLKRPHADLHAASIEKFPGGRGIHEPYGNGLDRRMVALVPLVRRVALKIRRQLPPQVELDDLVGAGVLGLVDAVRKFDESKQVRIETYAQHRIRGAILDSLRTLDHASRDMRRKGRRVEKIHHELEAKLRRPARNADVARALGVSLEAWYRTAQDLHASGVDCLQHAAGTDLRQPLEEAQLPDRQESAFDQCYRREQREILNRAMASLPERERRVISFYYHRALTLKQIGSRLGVDESRVSQIHSAALLRLRACINAILCRPALTLPPDRLYS